MKFAGMVFLISLAGTLRAGVLSLTDAQALLFKNNLDVLTAEEEIEKARNELSESYAGYWPSLDANGSYSYQSEKNSITMPLKFSLLGRSIDTTIQNTIGANDQAQCGLNLSYPFFTGFRRHFAVTDKKENIAVKQAVLDEVKERASFGLGLLYLQWELSYRQTGVRRALVEQLATYTKQLTAMRDAGTVQLSKVLEGQAHLKLAEVDVVTAEEQSDSLGLEIRSSLLLKDGPIVPDTTCSVVDSMRAPGAPLAKRPELIALDHATAQVEAMRMALKFRHFPTLSGLAGLRYGRPGLDMGRNEYMGYGLVGIQAEWNLFDGFKTKAEQAQLDRQINFIDIERTRIVETYTRSFELAQTQLRNAGERLVAVKGSRDAAAALLDDARNSLALGTVTNADYLNALVNLDQADLVVEQVKTMKKMALLKLVYAAGVTIKY
jgi:outer membrane protein TolC